MMAKILRLPLTVFLVMALTYIVPPDGVNALKCLFCTGGGNPKDPPCDKSGVKDCKADEELCFFSELGGGIVDRGCTKASTGKQPKTCTDPSRPSKTCYCNIDLCNTDDATFNSITAAPGPTTDTTKGVESNTTTTTVPNNATEDSKDNTTTHDCPDYVDSSSTSMYVWSGVIFFIIGSGSTIYILNALQSVADL